MLKAFSSLSARPRAVVSAARSLSTAAYPPPVAAIALYDGSCPLCAREIAFLRTFSKASAVSFVDVSTETFDDAAFFAAQRVEPVAREKLLDEMHVVDVPRGVVHSRVRAFNTLYSALGYPRALAFTAHPPWDAIADRVYEFVRLNKHRVAWLAR